MIITAINLSLVYIVEHVSLLFLLQCFSSRYITHCRLTPDEVQSLQFKPQKAGPDEEMDSATEFGRSARQFEDKTDELLQAVMNESYIQEFISTCVSESDPGQATSTALQSFITVAGAVLEVDERGIGMVLNRPSYKVCWSVCTLHIYIRCAYVTS